MGRLIDYADRDEQAPKCSPLRNRSGSPVAPPAPAHVLRGARGTHGSHDVAKLAAVAAVLSTLADTAAIRVFRQLGERPMLLGDLLGRAFPATHFRDAPALLDAVLKQLGDAGLVVQTGPSFLPNSMAALTPDGRDVWMGMRSLLQ